MFWHSRLRDYFYGDVFFLVHELVTQRNFAFKTTVVVVVGDLGTRRFSLTVQKGKNNIFFFEILWKKKIHHKYLNKIKLLEIEVQHVYLKSHSLFMCTLSNIRQLSNFLFKFLKQTKVCLHISQQWWRNSSSLFGFHDSKQNPLAAKKKPHCLCNIWKFTLVKFILTFDTESDL